VWAVWAVGTCRCVLPSVLVVPAALLPVQGWHSILCTARVLLLVDGSIDAVFIHGVVCLPQTEGCCVDGCCGAVCAACCAGAVWR
jgi:hypothetical protein